MNADARIRAWNYYRSAGRDLEADLAALSAHPEGVILLMPRLVVLMKPVLSTTPDQWGLLSDEAPAADAWYVHLLTGDLNLARRLAAALPPRQWLCFQRGLRSPAPHRLSWHAFLHHHTHIEQTMGFSKTSNYRTDTTTIPVVTQTAAGESQLSDSHNTAQKKGLLSTILSSHRREDSDTSEKSSNTTLG